MSEIIPDKERIQFKETNNQYRRFGVASISNKRARGKIVKFPKWLNEFSNSFGGCNRGGK